MKKKMVLIMLIVALVATSSVFASGAREAARPSGDLRLVLLVKSLGNGFFEAVADGGKEAAAELGNVVSIY